MAESFYQGYLIKKIPFQIFDEIITFMTRTGQKITCMALGTRKIESKNGRFLFLGSLLEFEIFQSRSTDKLSKLKRVSSIKPLEWKYSYLESFNLLNECADKTVNATNELYEFYGDHLKMISSSLYEDKRLILIILRNYCKILGIGLEVNSCVRCGSKHLKTISFKSNGMICNNCFDPKSDKPQSLELSKAIHYLFNDKYDELVSYADNFDYLIKLLRIYIFDMSGVILDTLQVY